MLIMPVVYVSEMKRAIDFYTSTVDCTMALMGNPVSTWPWWRASR